ncbi:hypothetical protein PVAP13_4NG229544 [Panicum virgatum]|uniref:Zinc finger GRF-type domain-containing protein n=1 Tax=Panicum virgatum TaxID=38727 RepID=A0A8T0T5G7_PANVG|nr:hypothetical protein PVAP13_4NG229544 [Panicum virgatum]
MASSSGSSHNRGSFWSAGRNVDSSSPIPYRERPLDYTPAVMCKCGAKAAMFTSWSDLHPGMRYLKCARARVVGCDFWLWVDPPHSQFVKQLLLDLRDAVRSLRQEKGALQCQLQDAERSNVALQGAFADAERSNAALQGALADARRENATIQAAYVEARRENADVDGRRDVQSL